MRIDIHFSDRVGIAQEILAVLAGRKINVAAVEVEPPHIFIDAPELTEDALEGLRQAFGAVSGVDRVQVLDVLPGVRRRLHLEALLAALADPAFLVDAEALVLVANPAATDLAGMGDAVGQGLGRLFGEAGLDDDLRAVGFSLPVREVMLGRRAFLLEARPVAERSPGAAIPAGGVITLHDPTRLGARMHALRPYYDQGFESLIGESAPLRLLKERAARLAAVEAPLLILGETGTGKELIAHACHEASRRRSAPFLALNCAAVPENLAESELFGYAPGAFTGARRGGKPGLLELADKGTVFLDEIGELSPYLQAKLLRFLSDGRFRRVGGEAEVKVDVRILSATHRDLERMVAEKTFRQDLFYRLNVLTLAVPPLRERGQDILLLAEHFLARAAAQIGQPGFRLSSGAKAALLTHDWPGNVRQLENVIFRAATLADTALLEAADLDLAPPAGAVSEELDDVLDWEQAQEAFEKALLARLYPRYPSSRRLAARLKTSHTMIANRLRKYRIP